MNPKLLPRAHHLQFSLWMEQKAELSLYFKLEAGMRVC